MGNGLVLLIIFLFGLLIKILLAENAKPDKNDPRNKDK